MSLLVSGANLFLYCYYGNRSTIDYAQMAHSLYESNWYQHSVGLQRFFKMMIANAQRPLFYHGFRIVQLNLETYLKVTNHYNRIIFANVTGSHSNAFRLLLLFQLLKTVISYYLMFKTLAMESS